MIRTLHIDIEGGWGGSSRSLFQLVDKLDRDRVTPVVAHRQSGPIAERYREIGVEAVHVPGIFSFAPRDRKSGRSLIAHLPRLRGMPGAMSRVSELAQGHRAELLHLNYEGLAFMGRLLRRRLGLPVICHSRTMIPDNGWGRMLVRQVRACSDYVFFISEMEEARFRSLEQGPPHPGEVLWNIAEARPRTTGGNSREAVYIGNIDATKGTDRLIDIAAALDEIGAPEITIAVYGKARGGSAFEAELRRRAAPFAHRLSFRGHTADPESVVAGAFALLRPSRGSDPWGRDVIEATVSGTPVIATGSYEGVVRHGVTGYLCEPFDARRFAELLSTLALDRDCWSSLSANARSAGTRFSGVVQRERFAVVGEALVAAARTHEPGAGSEAAREDRMRAKVGP